jgi:N-acetylneuraminate synthase/N,N'-diacetyllegionaminate synthase
MQASQTLRIGPAAVARDGAPLVIAEIGVNHDGSVARARDLIAAARQAGAGAVKFQLFTADLLLAQEAGLVAYQKASAASARELLRPLEMSAEQMTELVAYGRSLGLATIITPFSPALAPVAQACACDALKLASPDLVNRPLVEAAAATGLPLILSTGAARLEEIERTLGWLGEAQSRTVLLQCVSSYPTAPEDASLAGVSVLRTLWPQIPIGYSDHTTLSITGALAVAAGACVLEKHLTLNVKAAGPDHAVSLEPGPFGEYVRLAELSFRMRGALSKAVLPAEIEVRMQTRQSVAAAVDLTAGTVLRAEYLTVQRPGTGIPAAGLRDLLGRRVVRPVAAGTLLNLRDLGDPEDV